MKINFLRKSTMGIALAALCLASDPSVQFSNAQAQPAPPPPTGTDASAVPPASVTPPPNILPNSPLAQVIRLVQAGVDESVIMSYVTNSTGTFNLDSDTIIYLSDLGVPNEVVTAMMQRDQRLQQQAGANPPPPPTTEPTEPPPPPPTEVTVNYFYSSLTPYGTWVNVSGYGRCWRPTIVVYGSGWQPYCDRGHWVYTDCGWYWASDYSWGITFHYGRWFRDAHLGWCWWPDTAWAPSWVTWRYSNDYCGWAPLPPFAVYRPGAGFFYHGSGVSVSFDFGLAINCFTFVPTQHFCDPRPWHYRVAARDETQIYHQTTVINNFNFDSRNRTFVNNGIGVQHITDVTRTPIHPVPVRELSVSARQPWRGGPGITTGNPPHPGSTVDNRHNFTPRGGTTTPNQGAHPGNNQNQQPNHNWPAVTQNPNGAPGQNHIKPPANNPVSPPTYRWPDNAQTQTPNNDNKHVASPRGQQFEEQTPHYNPPSPGGNNNTIRPDQHQTGSPGVNNSVPVERPQQNNDSHQNSSGPPAGSVTPSSPPASSSSPPPRSSQPSQSSQSSNRSNNQGQNQNGRGH